MIHFFVFPRRNFSTPLSPITSLQTQQFHAITHSFPQRRLAISLALNGFRTLFIATGVVPPVVSVAPIHTFVPRQCFFFPSFVFMFLRTAFPANTITIRLAGGLWRRIRWQPHDKR